MKTNTERKPEINLSAKNYIAKRPLTTGTLHLNSQRSEVQESDSNSEYKLTAGEELGCRMATD